jgi:hypothetical protein
LIVYNRIAGTYHSDTDKFEQYFMYLRAKTGTLVAKTPDGTHEINLSGTVRYVIVTEGGYHLFRKNGSKITAVHKGKRVAFCNDLTDPDFDTKYIKRIIDFNWYQQEAEKLWTGGLTEHELFTQEYES